MKTTISYPALVQALPPGHRKAKWSVACLETKVEVAEADGDDAPVALAVKDGHMSYSVRKQYRLHEGRLFVSTEQSPDRFFERQEENVLDRRYSLMSGLLAEMSDRLENGRVPDALLWPTEIRGALARGFIYGTDHRAAVAAARSLRIDGSQAAAIASQEARARAVADDFLVVDGTVWAVAMEPCYAVPRRAGGWGDVTISSADRYRKTVARETAFPRSEMHDALFGAGQIEDMIACGAADGTDFPEIEVLIPEALTLDFDAMELDRCARLSAQMVAANIKKALDGEAGRMPSDGLVRAWLRLRDAVKSYDPFDGVPDGLEGLLTTFVGSAADRREEWSILDGCGPELVTPFVERWRSRSRPCRLLIQAGMAR
jgi:hypothetical protein